MPLLDMVVLTLIIAAFVTFGVTLASVSWYCRDTTNRAKCQHELPVGHGPNQRSRIGVRAPDGGQDDLGYPHSEGHQTI